MLMQREYRTKQTKKKDKRYSEIIISETERIGTLITTLLDLSALENGAVSLMPERFDFVEFVETIAGRLLIDMPETDFELQYKLPENKVFVYTDKQRMEQVLNNFIVNAKKNVSQNKRMNRYPLIAIQLFGEFVNGI